MRSVLAIINLKVIILLILVALNKNTFAQGSIVLKNGAPTYILTSEDIGVISG